MHFTSFQFAVFFAIIIWLNWKLKGQGLLYKYFLVVANLIFYAAATIKFVPLLFIVAFAAWLTSFKLKSTSNPAKRKVILGLDVALNLSILAFFKYFEFFFTTFELLINPLGWAPAFRIPEILFPVGLSFFTFQGLSLAIDNYRQPKKEIYSFLDVFLYISFFPTVLSGPIQRAHDFIPQIGKIKFDPDKLSLGFALIISGLFKKVVLSSYLSEHIVRQVFQVPTSFSSWGVLAGIYGYSAQIYLDFSGYSDLAIGIGLLLGYNIKDNFNSPYMAQNIRDFWHRWHISLSTWLRDYLYIPLGGSRKGNRYLNLMITQTLGGLWHGAHLRYLIWGFAHGLALVVSHFFHVKMKSKVVVRKTNPSQFKKFIIIFFKIFLTFNFVSLLWVFFKAENMKRAFEVFERITSFNSSGEGASSLVWLVVLLTLGMQFFGGKIKNIFIEVQNKMPSPIMALWISFWLIVILKLGPDGVLPFIYFQY